jgi:hypothetical protein
MNQCKQGKKEKNQKTKNKKQQSKAVDLGVHNRFVCLIKKKLFIVV